MTSVQFGNARLCKPNKYEVIQKDRLRLFGESIQRFRDGTYHIRAVNPDAGSFIKFMSCADSKIVLDVLKRCDPGSSVEFLQELVRKYDHTMQRFLEKLYQEGGGFEYGHVGQ